MNRYRGSTMPLIHHEPCNIAFENRTMRINSDLRGHGIRVRIVCCIVCVLSVLGHSSKPRVEVLPCEAAYDLGGWCLACTSIAKQYGSICNIHVFHDRVEQHLAMLDGSER